MRLGTEYIHEGYDRNLIVYDYLDKEKDVTPRLVRLARNVFLNQGLNDDIVKIISPVYVSYDKLFVRIDPTIQKYYKEIYGDIQISDKDIIVIFVNDNDDALLGAI